jgi:hypothetical protein
MAREATRRSRGTPSDPCGNIRSLTHPAYIRDKARQLRIERDLTIDEIAQRLAVSRQTVFYCVRDLPMQRPRRSTAGERMRNKGNALRARLQAWMDRVGEEWLDSAG